MTKVEQTSLKKSLRHSPRNDCLSHLSLPSRHPSTPFFLKFNAPVRNNKHISFPFHIQRRCHRVWDTVVYRAVTRLILNKDIDILASDPFYASFGDVTVSIFLRGLNDFVFFVERWCLRCWRFGVWRCFLGYVKYKRALFTDDESSKNERCLQM